MSSNISNLSLSLLFQPAYASDPYPLYAQLQTHHPVYWDAELENWILTLYDDVLAAFQDPHLSSERILFDASSFPEMIRTLIEPSLVALTKQMIFLDPPDHTRLRGL